jgi:hypothetical protein
MELSKYKAAIVSYKLKLKADLFEAENIIPKNFQVFEFNTKELENRKKFEKKMSELGITNGIPFIYYFKIKDCFKREEIVLKIKSFKENHKNGTPDYLALPKINETTLQECLYVGKSEDELLTRLRVHFGYTGNGTYGLHLIKWFQNLGISNHFDIELHFTKIELETKKKHLLEILESALHFELKPILGRSGH